MAQASPNVPVLVMGSGITTLGVVRILGRKRIPRYVMGADGCVSRSRWYRPAPPPCHDGAGEGLAELLVKLPLERAVLMPCSDAWTLAVSALDGALAARFPRSVSGSASLHALIDKGLFADVLQQYAIPHPLTTCPANEDELHAIPDEAFERGFLKPTSSQAFHRRFDVKAFRFSGRAEALAQFRSAREARLEVMLQEYIPGPPTAHYFIDGFVNRHGSWIARFARRRLRMSPPDFGNSTYMVSVAMDEVEGAVASMERLLRGLRYRGIFSAEFKRDERDGVFKLLEVNARPWWYVEFAANCGVDVCDMAYRDALGLPVEPVTSYRIGRHSVYPYYDRAACLTLFRSGQLSLWSWAASWIRAEKPVLRWDDPSPAFFGTFEQLRKTLRRRLSS
jgi:D-aspartate ligase